MILAAADLLLLCALAYIVWKLRKLGPPKSRERRVGPLNRKRLP